MAWAVTKKNLGTEKESHLSWGLSNLLANLLAITPATTGTISDLPAARKVRVNSDREIYFLVQWSSFVQAAMTRYF
jgi:hypothetical protein